MSPLRDLRRRSVRIGPTAERRWNTPTEFDVRKASFAPPGLGIIERPEPRLTPWAIVCRCSAPQNRPFPAPFVRVFASSREPHPEAVPRSSQAEVPAPSAPSRLCARITPNPCCPGQRRWALSFRNPKLNHPTGSRPAFSSRESPFPFRASARNRPIPVRTHPKSTRGSPGEPELPRAGSLRSCSVGQSDLNRFRPSRRPDGTRTSRRGCSG
jgi:hypothetical protein